MTSGPTYTLASNGSSSSGGNYAFRKHHGSRHHHHNHHRRNNSDLDEDPTDGQGSLTYSATSSVQSGGSAAGESTDSSFADIMRVLDLQDGGSTSKEQLQALLKKEGVSSAVELREKRGYGTSGISVASSLNYSTDGESHLEGSQLLQTIAGQPSDSMFDANGGSSSVEEPIKTGDNDILFAPAEPANVKKKKRRDANGTPKAKNSSKRYESSPSPSMDTPTKSPPSSETKPGTPPPLPPNHLNKAIHMEEDDEDIWYAKWWMSCFPDSFKNLMPKR